MREREKKEEEEEVEVETYSGYHPQQDTKEKAKDEDIVGVRNTVKHPG